MIKEVLNKDYVFFSILMVILLLPTLIPGTSVLAIGGTLLVFGAWYIAVGNVFNSVIVYTIADVCWLFNAYMQNDMFGAITVAIGICTGLFVTYKMRNGEFRKSLLKDSDE